MQNIVCDTGEAALTGAIFTVTDIVLKKNLKSKNFELHKLVKMNKLNTKKTWKILSKFGHANKSDT